MVIASVSQLQKRQAMKHTTILCLGLTQCKKKDSIAPEVHTIVLQPGKGSSCVQEIIPVNTEKNTYAGEDQVREDLLVAARWNSLRYPQQQSWRSLLRFDELSGIPPIARIKSARLYLTGISSSRTFPEGNSHFPGSGTTDNSAILQRLNTNWNKEDLNWFNMPSTTEEGQAIIPASDRRWNYNVVADVTSMVQEMVAHPKENYGFLLRLQHETDFSALLFAPASCSDASARPRLEIEAVY
jgi:hypothetical protein